jgi:hypothetical protein
MFATTIPSYSTPVPTTFNATLSSAFENAKFTLSNGPNDILTKLGNKATITADSNAVLVQNRDCTVIVPNTASRTVTLPSAVGQIFPILIQKTSNNFLPIVVNRAAAPDTIADPFASTATPVTTSLTLYLPGEAYLFIPEGTVWRVVVLNFPRNTLGCLVTLGANQTLVGNVTLNLNTEIYDRGSFWNTTTYRWLPLVPGKYRATLSLTASAGTSADVTALIYKNATLIKENGYVGATASIVSSIVKDEEISLNGSTDFIEFRQANTASRTTLATTQYTSASVEFLGY